MEKYLIRTEMEPQEIYSRLDHVQSDQLPKVRKALRKLHAFEMMAVNIYRMQITAENTDFNRLIIQAMTNEMTHVQDFQAKIYEFGSRPSPTRFFNALLGMFLGLSSRLRGKKAILAMGIWTETKAVEDYQAIISSVRWDKETLDVIKHNLDDEYHHIETLKKVLEQI
ncbi:demethoxyubiquinone hydroxylase family protein [Syntrophobotulus glycolicus]|nr:demethoxyubiquinone hydroxylase family protein [Syntrophobotulus glycolicus]